MKLEGLSLFFPCHNEEGNVEGIIGDALRIAPQIAELSEVIIVDDGSTDRTSQIAERFAGQGHPVRVVRHAACQGYGAALRSGFRAARYPWIFYSDGDRQFDLSELPGLVELAAVTDMVSGYRLKRADPWHRRVNAWIFGWALRRLIGLNVPDVNCAFKLYRREIFDRIELKSSGAMINAEIFAKAQRLGYRLRFLGVTHQARRAGRQSGARPKVILKAARELWTLWREVTHET